MELISAILRFVLTILKYAVLSLLIAPVISIPISFVIALFSRHGLDGFQFGALVMWSAILLFCGFCYDWWALSHNRRRIFPSLKAATEPASGGPTRGG